MAEAHITKEWWRKEWDGHCVVDAIHFDQIVWCMLEELSKGAGAKCRLLLVYKHEPQLAIHCMPHNLSGGAIIVKKGIAIEV